MYFADLFLPFLLFVVEYPNLDCCIKGGSVAQLLNAVDVPYVTVEQCQREMVPYP